MFEYSPYIIVHPIFISNIASYCLSKIILHLIYNPICCHCLRSLIMHLHVIHTKTMTANRVLGSLEKIEINQHLLSSLTDLNNGSGFLVPLGTHRNSVNEATVYLGCLEVNMFNYLKRKITKSNALFDRQQQKRIILVFQLDEKVGYRDYICVIPLYCIYNYFEEYLSFVYSIENSQ